MENWQPPHSKIILKFNVDGIASCEPGPIGIIKALFDEFWAINMRDSNEVKNLSSISSK